jgi:hypothetical protein
MTTPSITIDGIEYVPATSLAPTETQVVLGLNDWVFVGNVSDDRDELVVTNARSVALEDSTLAALIDGSAIGMELGTVRIPKANVIARINVVPVAA